MSWDNEYNKNQQIWGETPSELALELVKHFIQYEGTPLKVLDVGCGYGRDSIFIAKSLGFNVLGIDISEQALDLAKKNLPKTLTNKIEFKYFNFWDLKDKFDVVLISNLYHLLSHEERFNFPRQVEKLLMPKGKLFLNAISVNDKEHYGKGLAVPNEENTWINDKYIHLSTKEDLRIGFTKLKIKELYEHNYQEPHPNARTHSHTAWILIAEKSN